MLALLLILSAVVPSLPAQPVMRVHVIDVGQGDATLFEFPCGAVLIDTGGESNGEFDSEDAVRQWLRTTDVDAGREVRQERIVQGKSPSLVL